MRMRARVEVVVAARCRTLSIIVNTAYCAPPLVRWWWCTTKGTTWARGEVKQRQRRQQQVTV